MVSLPSLPSLEVRSGLLAEAPEVVAALPFDSLVSLDAAGVVLGEFLNVDGAEVGFV